MNIPAQATHYLKLLPAAVIPVFVAAYLGIILSLDSDLRLYGFDPLGKSETRVWDEYLFIGTLAVGLAMFLGIALRLIPRWAEAGIVYPESLPHQRAGNMRGWIETRIGRVALTQSLSVTAVASAAFLSPITPSAALIVFCGTIFVLTFLAWTWKRDRFRTAALLTPDQEVTWWYRNLVYWYVPIAVLALSISQIVYNNRAGVITGWALVTTFLIVRFIVHFIKVWLTQRDEAYGEKYPRIQRVIDFARGGAPWIPLYVAIVCAFFNILVTAVRPEFGIGIPVLILGMGLTVKTGPWPQTSRAMFGMNVLIGFGALTTAMWVLEYLLIKRVVNL